MSRETLAGAKGPAKGPTKGLTQDTPTPPTQDSVDPNRPPNTGDEEFFHQANTDPCQKPQEMDFHPIEWDKTAHNPERGKGPHRKKENHPMQHPQLTSH